VEFAVLGTLIFGLLLETVVLFGVLHRATLATSAAARAVGRSATVASSASDADARARLAVSEAERNHGLAPGSMHPQIEGTRSRGGLLRVHVWTAVPVVRLPFVGAVVRSLSVTVESTNVVQLDPYKSGG
jgi:hypothetical protein